LLWFVIGLFGFVWKQICHPSVTQSVTQNYVTENEEEN